MKLIKVKGIVIKEIQYNDNDKILTVLTDKLGKISCMAKGAKKTNSSLLAPCQFLVYSEFILYKGTSFYHINSAEVIDTFYDLRIDYDKLEIAYEVTKIINQTICEGEETNEILSLFLNTLFITENKEEQKEKIIAVFKLKLIALLGYMPDIVTCKCCNCTMLNEKYLKYYYSFLDNSCLCENCFANKLNDKEFKLKGTYVALSQATYFAILFVASSSTKKMFNFKLEDNSLKEFVSFVNTMFSMVTNT